MIRPRPPDGIWPSSGARRAPGSVDRSRMPRDLLPAVWDSVCRSSPPWKAELTGQWSALVGPEFARHLRPGPTQGFRGRTLVVFADHPVIRFEAERALRDLAARIRAAIPDAPVDRVAFRADPGSGDPSADGQ